MLKTILLIMLEAIALIIVYSVIIGALYFVGTFDAGEFLL
jgi:hypothetical protein